MSLQGDDSDEENQCALSENWKFQRQSRRWSRIPGNFEAALAKRGTALDDQAEDEDDDGEHEAPSIEQCGSSYDSVLGVGSHRNLQETDDSALVSVTIEDEGCHSAAATLLPPDVAGLKRSNSERIKDGAKALLRRVESLKSRRSKRKTRNTVAMTGQHLDVPPPDDQDLAFVQVTPPDTPALTATASGGSSSPSPSSPLDSVPHASSNLRFFGGGPLQCRADGDPYALSDSECSPTLWRCGPASPTGPTGRCYIENFLAPDSPRPLHDGNTSGAPGEEGGLGINYRTGSFNLGGESGNFRERLRAKRVNKRSSSGMDPDRQSLYDNVPVVIFNQGYTDESGDKLLQADHSSGKCESNESVVCMHPDSKLGLLTPEK